jgi:hypothetical protein
MKAVPALSAVAAAFHRYTWSPLPYLASALQNRYFSGYGTSLRKWNATEGKSATARRFSGREALSRRSQGDHCRSHSQGH